MPRKSPIQERSLILANDQRRKYGSRVTFEVQNSVHIGHLENVTLLVEDGTIATITSGKNYEWENGKRYQVELKGFPTASEAEEAGMGTAQALLLTAISLNFGLRLNYHSHEPPTVFDRTVSLGITVSGAFGLGGWSQDAVLDELTKTMKLPRKDRRLLLSLELFVAAALESNDRARFVMAVSALEPLAAQQDIGPEVGALVNKLCDVLAADTQIPEDLRDSVRGRILQLKRESVSQALRRLCRTWFPDEPLIWQQVNHAYSLRSQMLHEGRPSDPDILLHEETAAISGLLRRIYQHAFGYNLRSPV